MEYNTSNKELNRRKKAFIALLVSSMIGFVLFSFLFNFSLSPMVFLLIGVSCLLVLILALRAINSSLKIKIRILDQAIERAKDKTVEKYPLSSISTVKIKRRTNGIIREIYIYFDNHKPLFINALEEEFENLKNNLIEKAQSKIIIKEIHEPLDFDHLLFYPILGLIISFIFLLVLKLAVSVDYSILRILDIVFAIYTFVLAIYFFIKKPISTRSGKNQIVADYIFSVIMVAISVLVLVFGLRL